MENTVNKICRCIVSLLEQHGVRRAIVSPGSRNAPLLIALSRSESIACDVVIDERNAGFVALGYSTVANEPVALICTSGTALLNYAPAIAEAYYRKAPLIVISADRPYEWIGQDDSQTIVQPGALANYVKRSYNIPSTASETNLWYANRVTNDALLTAVTGRRGPVHLNVQLNEPLGKMTEDLSDDCHGMLTRKVSIIKPKATMLVSEARALGKTIASPRKVMIVAGFMSPDKILNKALNKLSQLPNITVFTETIANLHGRDFVNCIDSALASMCDEKRREMKPDVVITLGGALVSRHIKRYLREMDIEEHWHVGEIDDTVDCFQHLTLRVEMSPEIFFPMLASAMQPHREVCEYSRQWGTIRNRANSLTAAYCQRAAWSDLKAFQTIIPMIPRRWNVQYSNGTSIRYAQFFGDHEYHRCDCNRGVSGIDGSTATAIGASMAYKSDVTLLITGDMSASYDIGSLFNGHASPRLKIVIINNGGGGIFRFISSTSNLDVREQLFCCRHDTSFDKVAEAAGFKWLSASSENELRLKFKDLTAIDDAPAILVVNTPAEESAEILKNYFVFCKTH